MGRFSKFFKKEKKQNEPEDKPQVVYAPNDSKMGGAMLQARDTFKYFWRELFWEYRRIVPALGVACVKASFSQQFEGRDEPIVEHMWINEIGFDGEKIYGTLTNQPHDLTNVKKDDQVEIRLNQISDWMFSIAEKTYGGFTIHALRSEMSEEERATHDSSWGLDFGDFNDILLAYEQKEHPENLIEHPMSVSMKEQLEKHLKESPDDILFQHDSGHTMLIDETIAGNKTTVELLIKEGADINAKTNKGKTALDFAKELNWEHLIPLLEK